MMQEELGKIVQEPGGGLEPWETRETGSRYVLGHSKEQTGQWDSRQFRCLETLELNVQRLRLWTSKRRSLHFTSPATSSLFAAEHQRISGFDPEMVHVHCDRRSKKGGPGRPGGLGRGCDEVNTWSC